MSLTQQQIQNIKDRIHEYITHDGKTYRVDICPTISGRLIRICVIRYDERVSDYNDVPLSLMYSVSDASVLSPESSDQLQDTVIYLKDADEIVEHFYQALLNWLNYSDSFEIVDKVTTKEERFTEELTSLLNKYSEEGESNTPDFILATYLKTCLHAFNTATNRRSEWYKK